MPKNIKTTLSHREILVNPLSVNYREILMNTHSVWTNRCFSEWIQVWNADQYIINSDYGMTLFIYKMQSNSPKSLAVIAQLFHNSQIGFSHLH